MVTIYLIYILFCTVKEKNLHQKMRKKNNNEKYNNKNNI